MTIIVLLVFATSCLWLSSLAASTLFFSRLWRMRWGAALLSTYPLWWYAQLFITKGLSLFGAINQRSLIIATCILFIVPVTLTLILKPKNSSLERLDLKERDLKQVTGEVEKARASNKLRAAIRSYWPEGLTAAYLGLMIVAAALLYPPHPQIWDTYTYHLPMIANWLQQGSLDPWPTACLRQITRAGGAEYQQLWVLGMPHVDLFTELPSILAGVISAVFVWETAHRWGASRIVALSAGLSLLAVPQIVWALLTTKDDLIMTAAILCATYNAIASFSEPRSRLASFHAAVAAVSAALICATKVPGLGFGGIFILLYTLFLLRTRMWKRFWIVVAIFLATSGPAFAIQYVHNLEHYGALYEESFPTRSRPDVHHPAFQGGLFSSARTILKLLAYAGVGSNYVNSNYGIWFSLVVLPLVAITNWSSIRTVLKGKLGSGAKAVDKERRFVAMYLFLSFAVMLSWRTFIPLDARFMIWICPVFLVLGMHAVENYISPIFFRTLCVGFAILTVRAVLGTGYPAVTGISLSGTIKVSPTSDHLPGYEAISQAMPGDTVLYIGGRGTAESPCWGWKYDRIVWAADSTVTLNRFFARLPNWVVLEEESPTELHAAALEQLSSHQYKLVSQDAASQAHLRPFQRRTIWRR